MILYISLGNVNSRGQFSLGDKFSLSLGDRQLILELLRGDAWTGKVMLNAGVIANDRTLLD